MDLRITSLPKVLALFTCLLQVAGCGYETSPEHEGQVHFHVSETPSGFGEACSFGWPREGEQAPDFEDYPVCAPLQRRGGPVELNNEACPVDCIQMPSLECEAMMCVATQVPGDTVHMNGQCWKMEEDILPKVRCIGYCTMQCQDETDCPVGSSCEAMLPFADSLQCENEDEWGTECVGNCVPAGESPAGTDIVCPSSRAGEAGYGYEQCSLQGYEQCCACICYRFCPLVDLKFCRKTEWDSDLFPGGISESDQCG